MKMKQKIREVFPNRNELPLFIELLICLLKVLFYFLRKTGLACMLGIAMLLGKPFQPGG